MKHWIVLILLSVPLLWGCEKEQNKDNAPAKIKLVATTGMIGDAAKVLGGDHFEVVTLIGSGLDPHLYKATEGDVRRLYEAEIVLFHGLHLEGKLVEILEAMSKKKTTVAVAEAVPESQLLVPPDGGGQWDPHVWFDVQRWLLVVEKIAQVLRTEAPEFATSIDANLQSYKKELEALDQEVRAKLQAIPEEKRLLVTAHDAFHYLGDAYGLEVTGLQGISTVVEAGAKDVQQLAEMIAARGVPAIFVESSVPKKSILALQEAVAARGVQVKIGEELYSDAMGPEGSGADSYVGMVQHNIKALVHGLAATEPTK